MNTEKKGLTTGKKIVIVAGLGSLVIVLAWFLFLFQPKNKQLQSVKSDIGDAKAEETELRAELGQLEALKEKEPEIDAAFDEINALIPDTASLSVFIEEANRVASEAGLNWISVAPAEPQTLGPVSGIGLTMSLEGSFFQVVDYLDRIEKMPRAVTCDSMQVSRGDASVLSVQLSCRMFTLEGAGETGSTSASETDSGSPPAA